MSNSAYKKDKWTTVSEIEREIVQAMADGLKVVEIAEKRDRSSNTVSSQIYTMLKRFDCSSSANLVAEFLRRGIIK